jgi:hypothetical protein
MSAGTIGPEDGDALISLKEDHGPIGSFYRNATIAKLWGAFLLFVHFTRARLSRAPRRIRSELWAGRQRFLFDIMAMHQTQPGYQSVLCNSSARWRDAAS